MSTQKKQKSTQKQSTEKKQSRSRQLNELSTEELTAVFTEAMQTAQKELAEEEAEQKRQQKQTEAEAEQTATETAEQKQRIEQTVTDRQLAELKAVADSFVIKDNKFHVAVESANELVTAEGEGTDNSVFIGRYGFGSNGNGELVSVWCRRKATDRQAIMYTAWMDNGQKKSTKKEKHAFPCDFGLRFSLDDFNMFRAEEQSRAVIDSFSTEHAEIKHNEPRFSFPTLSAVTEALATLYNAYETAQQTAEQTKEAAEQTAEQNA